MDSNNSLTPEDAFQKLAEQSAREKQKALEELNEVLETALIGLAHDTRVALTLLERNASEEELRAAWGPLYKEAIRAVHNEDSDPSYITEMQIWAVPFLKYVHAEDRIPRCVASSIQEGQLTVHYSSFD